MRERRRVRRMDARLDSLLSQVVVEAVEEVPLAEVLPNTGKPPKGRGRVSKATPLGRSGAPRGPASTGGCLQCGGRRRWF